MISVLGITAAVVVIAVAAIAVCGFVVWVTQRGA